MRILITLLISLLCITSKAQKRVYSVDGYKYHSPTVSEFEKVGKNKTKLFLDLKDSSKYLVWYKDKGSSVSINIKELISIKIEEDYEEMYTWFKGKGNDGTSCEVMIQRDLYQFNLELITIFYKKNYFTLYIDDIYIENL